MGHVKGSKQIPLVLKPHQPVFQWALVITTLAVVAALLLAAYFYGMRVAVSEREQMVLERAELEDDLQQQQQRLSELKQEIAVYKHGTEVTRQATEEVRLENKRLRDQIAELQESVAFYKGVMDPSRNVRGLKIENLELESTGNEKRFRYKFVLTQVADNSRYIEGTVYFSLVGLVNGEKAVLQLKEVSQEVEDVGAKFRFRYFQDFSGELVLPEAFAPEQVKIVAQSRGRGAVRLEEMYDWPKQEKPENVGQG